MQLDFDGRSKDLLAIDRIRFHTDNGRIVPLIGLSGGKDSTVLRDLSQRTGIEIEPYYSYTTVDPPELVQFIQQQWLEVKIIRPEKTMWQLIEAYGMLPRRNARYCCEELKESVGSGRLVVTGIRAAESNARALRHVYETCRTNPSKSYLNPILDWSTAEVWGYIRDHKLPYCSLYKEGFKRLGCVLCPMSRNQKREIARWPKIALAYRHAVDRIWPGMVARHPDDLQFQTPEQYWHWWLSPDSRAPGEGQCLMHFE